MNTLEFMRTFAHSSHFYGRSPVCIRSWSRRLCSRLNDLPHVLHVKYLSPEWIRSCLRKWDDCLNDVSHVLHLCGLSSVNTFMVAESA